ncbi:zinc finger protein reh1 [Yamadazyma tenuis]|uniref:C2H2-type domain-containing protein n=1 Tax=Candida tenuis (strain ATCC 10573 / BCRC 21748 / CBS 615 / JCM 9827 / NBRC 10315 / NRRL Y-1498 / VKM Y-70) TaxID=590646 RepID=G3AXD0_CANTC|nr:uncharacterized protein CANTEDRAFT_112094 [Yamadazyma tenuis ATCC 10573]XP_006683996.1 uncharacterized protein CANTEDRAFT_112094 [Yamadazyma tenuis ATCC 10573]EGV66737.1 hypothetical protein CANTEDRAFT_112094 [Yamadazyma tenuis ATCC 10573]EGV66738.1 hypothetical protein CANTEDRAFT_112094 [Yamadazyma tenuis ATCC 10573]WEJ95531.1 zinc finger protein reh1 [Yamadazyma tenuis]
MSTDITSFVPQMATPSTVSFICNTCGIKFIAADMQRKHMKTEWHRYNLKRRVAQLPPISSDVFAHKILQQQRLAEIRGEVDEFGFSVKPKKVGGKSKTMSEIIRGRVLSTQSNTLNRESSPATSVVSEFSQFSLGDGVSVHEESESNIDTASEFNLTDHSNSDWEFDSTTEEEATESEAESLDDGLTEVMPVSFCFYCGLNNNEVETNVEHMYRKHGLYLPERPFLQDLDGLLTFLSEVIVLDKECLVCGFVGKNLESIRQHMICKGHCKLPYESDAEKNVVAEFYGFEAETAKRVADGEQNDQVIIHTSEHFVAKKLSKTLPSGLEVGHRSMFKYSHPPASLVRNSRESQRSIALVDRRYAPGLSAKILSRQERQVKRLEQRTKNLETRRSSSKQSNVIMHFRDELLQ